MGSVARCVSRGFGIDGSGFGKGSGLGSGGGDGEWSGVIGVGGYCQSVLGLRLLVMNHLGCQRIGCQSLG